MASDGKRTWKHIPTAWLFGAIIISFIAGFCCANHNNPLCIVFALGAIICSIISIHYSSRIVKKMRYVMEATISGDFSYKFPISDVNKEDREINKMLNGMVEHFERLTNEVRQNEAFLSRLINITDIGLVMADTNGNIRLHNKAALRLLERPALTHICQISRQAFEELAINKSEVTVNDKSFTLFTINDLSRQMQNVEVESWEKLTRVLTHEIMNSLTPIQSIAENMSSKSSNPEITEALEIISSSSRSLMQFVKNFREFNILPEAQMRALYLKPILESSISIANSYITEKHISVTLTCFPPELMVYTDESLLSRVLINILKNAIEANPDNISIEADEKADESVEIRISNDGELIPYDTINHIFTPFFTTYKSGSGIGLSLSRRIMSHLGGTLTLKARPITCFIVRL